MTTSMPSPVVLTVRGTLIPKSAEEARILHNETAGSAQGIAAARALGDLSHSVYLPSLDSKQSGAKDGELLFLDRWDNPQGIMEFFSNPHVQQQGGNMFSVRDAAVWMPARGAFVYSLPAPKAKSDRFIGMIRGQVRSAEEAVGIFARADQNAQRDARRRGMLMHEVFIKLNAPGDASPVELLAVDLWCDFAGMSEHYSDPTHMTPLGGAWAAKPQVSAWEQPRGPWSEW